MMRESDDCETYGHVMKLDSWRCQVCNEDFSQEAERARADPIRNRRAICGLLRHAYLSDRLPCISCGKPNPKVVAERIVAAREGRADGFQLELDFEKTSGNSNADRG